METLNVFCFENISADKQDLLHPKIKVEWVKRNIDKVDDIYTNCTYIVNSILKFNKTRNIIWHLNGEVVSSDEVNDSLDYVVGEIV